MSVNFAGVCLLEVVDPAAMQSNGDPVCPTGLAGFQTLSGSFSVATGWSTPEHHALCAPLCYADAECSWGNKCILVMPRAEAGGHQCGVCLPF